MILTGEPIDAPTALPCSIAEFAHVSNASGANVAAARRLLAGGRLREGAVVATILCDTGLKY